MTLTASNQNNTSPNSRFSRARLTMGTRCVLFINFQSKSALSRRPVKCEDLTFALNLIFHRVELLIVKADRIPRQNQVCRAEHERATMEA
jgi:hypothetical protein